MQREDVLQLLTISGAKLMRSKRHHVYALPNGQKYTIPSTPSDHRGWANCYSDLRRILDVPRQEKPKRIQRQRHTEVAPFRPFDINIPVNEVPAPKTLAEQLMGLTAPRVVTPVPAQEPEQPSRVRRERRESQHGKVFRYSAEVIQHANHILSLYGEQKYREFLDDYQETAHHEPEARDMNTQDIERMVVEAKGKLQEIDEAIAEAHSREEQARADAEKKEQQKKEVQDFITSAEMTLENAKLIAPMFLNGTKMLAQIVKPSVNTSAQMTRGTITKMVREVVFPELQKSPDGMSCIEMVAFLNQQGCQVTSLQVSQVLSTMKATERSLPFIVKGKLRGTRYYWRS